MENNLTPQFNQFSLEEEFKITFFNNQIQNLTREQAIILLSEVYRQMLIKEKMYQFFIKTTWKV